MKATLQASPPPDMDQLDDLLASGLITQAEYDAKRDARSPRSSDESEIGPPRAEIGPPRASIEFGDNDANQFVPCGFCTRTFFPDRLAQHHRVCQKKRAAGRESRLGMMSGTFGGGGDRISGEDGTQHPSGGGADRFGGGGGGYPGMAHMPGGGGNGMRGGGGGFGGGGGGFGGGGGGHFGGGGDRFGGGGGYPGMSHMTR